MSEGDLRNWGNFSEAGRTRRGRGGAAGRTVPLAWRPVPALSAWNPGRARSRSVCLCAARVGLSMVLSPPVSHKDLGALLYLAPSTPVSKGDLSWPLINHQGVAWRRIDAAAPSAACTPDLGVVTPVTFRLKWWVSIGKYEPCPREVERGASRSHWEGRCQPLPCGSVNTRPGGNGAPWIASL